MKNVSLTEVLTLESLGDDAFRAIHHKENFQHILFGGQVLAQALMAAGQTVDSTPPHSLHAYFLRAGNSDDPVDYYVTRTRDGRSFKNRSVEAVQNGKTIFSMMASFHKPETGFEHAQMWQSEPLSPESVPTQVISELRSKNPKFEDGAFEFRPLTAGMFSGKAHADKLTRGWVRCAEDLGSDPLTQACILAYASDFGLLACSLVEHPASLFKGDVMGASIDHALWFHSASFSINDWVLCDIDSPWAGAARGFSRGSIYSRQGQLLATSAQEGLIRPLS